MFRIPRIYMLGMLRKYRKSLHCRVPHIDQLILFLSRYTGCDNFPMLDVTYLENEVKHAC